MKKSLEQLMNEASDATPDLDTFLLDAAAEGYDELGNAPPVMPDDEMDAEWTDVPLGPDEGGWIDPSYEWVGTDPMTDSLSGWLTDKAAMFDDEEE